MKQCKKTIALLLAVFMLATPSSIFAQENAATSSVPSMAAVNSEDLSSPSGSLLATENEAVSKSISESDGQAVDSLVPESTPSISESGEVSQIASSSSEQSAVSDSEQSTASSSVQIASSSSEQSTSSSSEQSTSSSSEQSAVSDSEQSTSSSSEQSTASSSVQSAPVAPPKDDASGVTSLLPNSEPAPPTEVNNPNALAAADPIVAFVTRMYNIALVRELDGNAQMWINDLRSGAKKGVDIAYGIFCGTEFMEKTDKNDREFLERLYKVVLDRGVDEEGLKNWPDAMQNGLSREYVLEGVLNSTEFSERCAEYGIVRGDFKSPHPRDQNHKVTRFVARLYKLCLKRDGEPEGLDDWTERLNTNTHSGAETVNGFLNSGELRNSNISDVEFLDRLYHIVFDRGPDPTGSKTWLGLLKQGVSRDYIIAGLLNSGEFDTLCESFGIRAGRFETTQPRDRKSETTNFVNNAYLGLLGRAGDEDGLNSSITTIFNGSTGNDVLNGLMGSGEFKDRIVSESDFVSGAYLAAFGRTPNGTELAAGIADLASVSRIKFVQILMETNEFAAYGKKCAVKTTSTPNSSGRIIGIDVSRYQNKEGAIDWNAVKNSGVEFVMVRAVSTDTVSVYEDPYFRQNVRGAKAAGLKVGAYLFFYATTPDEVTREITYLMNAITALEAEGYRFDYPVAVDVEENIQKLSVAELTGLTQQALVMIEQRGYYPMLYSGSNFLQTQLDYNALKGYDLWIANYNGSVSFPSQYKIWQYAGGNKGTCPGITGGCDRNYSYVDYADIIRNTINSQGVRWNHW